MLPFPLGFIGAGRMATAFASGIVAQNRIPAEQIWASDPSESSLVAFGAAIPGARLLSDNREVAAACPFLVLAVKPQMARQALAGIDLNGPDTLVVSLMAGVRIATLQEWLGSPPIVRVMPNTPCLIGAGAMGWSAAAAVSREQRAAVASLLSAMGIAVEVEENQLDAVTGLSGSGPAYVFSLLRGLIAGGTRAGLNPQQARQLAIQTVAGSARLLELSTAEPAELISQVTSPGGTTFRGLEVLQAGQFEKLLERSVLAAADRARELSDQVAVS